MDTRTAQHRIVSTAKYPPAVFCERCTIAVAVSLANNNTQLFNLRRTHTRPPRGNDGRALASLPYKATRYDPSTRARINRHKRTTNAVGSKFTRKHSTITNKTMGKFAKKKERTMPPVRTSTVASRCAVSSANARKVERIRLRRFAQLTEQSHSAS